MAGARILFPQFRDEQGDSKYPFVDDATLQAEESAASVAKDVFIDASFYPIGGGTAAYLSAIVITETTFRFVVSTEDPVVDVVAQGDWSLLPPSGVFSLVFSDEYGRPAGVMLADVEKFRNFAGWTPGTYTFSSTAAAFVATLFVPAKEPGVRAIKTEKRDFLTGDVWLLGDAGVVLRVEGENVIRVDITGEPLFRRYACADADKVFPPKRFVKTINGCPPDEYGNFTFTATDKSLPAPAADTVLRIYPTLAGIAIEALGGGNA